MEKKGRKRKRTKERREKTKNEESVKWEKSDVKNIRNPAVT